MPCPKVLDFGLFWRPGEGGLRWPENFFGRNLPGGSQPPTQIIKCPRNDLHMGDKMTNIVKVIYTLGKADFESFGGLKVGTSLAKAGNIY